MCLGNIEWNASNWKNIIENRCTCVTLEHFRSLVGNRLSADISDTYSWEVACSLFCTFSSWIQNLIENYCFLFVLFFTRSLVCLVPPQEAFIFQVLMPLKRRYLTIECQQGVHNVGIIIMHFLCIYLMKYLQVTLLLCIISIQLIS